MHVFLSYAREDREQARIVASALEAEGWSVWWDRKLAAGQTFDRTIEEQLEIAGAVVVLWSASSVQSEWVRNEAGAANDRGLLVPAVLDDVPLPLEFRRRHTANRKSARFAVSEAGPVVFTMINTVDVVNYIFRVQPAGSAGP